MFDIQSLANTTPVLFILSASILTNFVGDTMGCKIQNIFSSNILAKYFIIFFVIYSTITIVDKTENPLNHFVKSLYILILFILFTKNTMKITLLVSLCMISLFIIEDYINFYKKNNKSETVEKLSKISMYIKYGILFLILYGHIIYIIKKRDKLGIEFDLIKLYTGSKCTII